MPRGDLTACGLRAGVARVLAPSSEKSESALRVADPAFSRLILKLGPRHELRALRVLAPEVLLN